MKSIIKILKTTNSLWRSYLIVAITGSLISVLALSSPFVLRETTNTIVDTATNKISSEEGLKQVAILALIFLFLEASKTVIQNIGGYFGDVMSVKVQALLSARYFAQLLALPQRWFDDQLTGTIIARLNRSIENIRVFMQTGANHLLPMILQIVVVLVVTSLYSPWIALLLIILAPLNLYLTSLTSKVWQKIQDSKNRQIDIANGRFAEVVAQPEVVKSFVREWLELSIFTRHYNRTISLTGRQSRFWHRMDIVRGIAIDIIFASIYMIIFVKTLEGKFNVGDLVMLIQLIHSAKMPLLSMSWLVDNAQRAISGSKDYFEIMEIPLPSSVPSQLASATTTNDLSELEKPSSDNTPPVMKPGVPMVVFDDVSFSYDDDQKVIHNVSFEVAKDEKVALVSESGGGKSTLVSLLLGLYPLQTGVLKIGGHDIASMTSAQIRAQIGVVFQESQLFSTTIAQNIAYGKPESSREEIVSAARRANAHDFIKDLPNGYDTLIGERGMKLSGGQRQRVAIARAMLKDAPILVLDEATSALDTKAEVAVQAGLEELMKGRTTIVIAHRLSTIAGVDKIVTLDNGKVQEIGSPVDLSTSGGIYAQLLDLTQTVDDNAKEHLKNYGFNS